MFNLFSFYPPEKWSMNRYLVHLVKVAASLSVPSVVAILVAVVAVLGNLLIDNIVSELMKIKYN